MSVTSRVMSLCIVLGILAVCSGCISEPGPQEAAGPTPTATASPQATSGVKEIVQATPGGPEQGQAPAQVYVESPFGYVAATQKDAGAMHVLEVKDETDENGERIITGRIKNEGSTRIDHATVTFNLFNSNGQVIGNAHATVHYLDPGKVWKFTTGPFSYPDYKYAEIAEIFTA